MSNNNKDSELSDDYMKKQYQMIKELYEGEKILNNILDNKTRKNDNFTIFDKGWLDKWKIIVGYQQFKEKCIKCKTEEDIKEYINDIREFYKKENVKQKLNELGKMKTDNLINISKKSKNIKFLNEKSNFIPILSHQSTYFNHLIDKVFSLNSEIENGIIFFYNTIPEKDKEQKIILLFKGEGENTNYIRPVITLKPKEDIKKVLKDLKKKTISEILNLKEYKFEIIKPEETIGSKEEITLNQNKFEKKKELEEKIKKEKAEEEEEKKKKKELEDKIKKEKAEEEEKKKKKELEDKIKKEKEDEEKKKKKELEEKIKKEQAEEEEKKKKKELEEKIKKEKAEEEEEKKKKKELEDKIKKEKAEEEEKKKKKELEDKIKKEMELKKEIEERKKKQEEDIKNEIENREKENKAKNRPVNKEYNIKLQNMLCNAVTKQILFEEKIKQNGNKKDENFFLSCKVINKEYLNNFEKILNYDSIKEKISQNPNDANKIFQDAINNNIIKDDELENLVPKKPEQLIPQALVDIEKLAFVDDEFAAKIMQFCHNSNQNMNNQNNNIDQINNQNSPLAQIPKANIVLNNGAGVIQTHENSNQVFTMNFKDNNINKPENIQVFNFPKIANFNISNQISKKSENGLIQEIKNKYISFNQNKNIEPPNPIKKENPIIPKDRKTLDGRDVSLGLDNVGATCYMNATLQCLAHLKRITEHIINYRENGKIKDVKKYRLCEAYSEVVCEIWKKDSVKKSFAPERFKKVLGEMNSLFAPTAANDAKDLLIYFIEQMHTELNVSPETNLNLVMTDDMNPTNHQQVLKCFIEEFMKKYNSVFSHYCYGSNVSVTNCNGCGVQKFSYQCFSFIIFPLLEAKKNCVLEGRLNPMYYNNYTLNIEDCFRYNQKIEFFNGSNQMYCNVCQGSRDSWMQTRISSPPLVLILIINRGKGNLDFREPFIFWETIDIKGYVEFPLPDNKYFLSGVVSHMGDSGPSGHFIAYCRMSENQKWYCYNDSLVTESNFQEINSRGFPYILFYQKSQM